MKKIFIYLLRCYSNTEAERIAIHKILHEGVENTYTEQTPYGNVYNSYIKFIMANPLVNKFVKNENNTGLMTLDSWLKHAYVRAIEYIKNETACNT